MLAIVDAVNINKAPIKNGIKVLLYSAFSSTLPIIYLIPKIMITITDITEPMLLKTDDYNFISCTF